MSLVKDRLIDRLNAEADPKKQDEIKRMIAGLGTEPEAVPQAPAAPLGRFKYIDDEERLEGHVGTLEALCADFAGAMLEKLRRNEVKRAAAGLSSNWQADDWQADCIAQLNEHVAKGDPKDVAILAAFCWFHGWHTGGATLPAEAPAPAVDKRQLDLFQAPEAKVIDLVPENCKGHACNFLNSIDKAICKTCPIAAMQPVRQVCCGSGTRLTESGKCTNCPQA